MLFAKPWWVNLLILIPIIAFILWRKGLFISSRILFMTAIFGIAFGYVETSVVIYLRRIFQLIVASGFSIEYSNAKIPIEIPHSLMRIEIYRETATIIMLLAVAAISVKNFKERTAIFIWTFAFWDIFYYFWLWTILKWPSSVTTQDTLFLIPVPWVSNVWFPIFVSLLAILAIIFRIKKHGTNTKKSSPV